MAVPRPTPEQLANLVNSTGIAQILSASLQQVSNLARTHPGFPDPICALPGHRGTPLYWRPDVEAFAAGWDRRPGNPTFRRHRTPEE